MHNAHAHSHNDRFLLQTTVYAQRCSMFYFAKRHICEEHKMKCKQNIYDFATYMLQSCMRVLLKRLSIIPIEMITLAISNLSVHE